MDTLFFGEEFYQRYLDEEEKPMREVNPFDDAHIEKWRLEHKTNIQSVSDDTFVVDFVTMVPDISEDELSLTVYGRNYKIAMINAILLEMAIRNTHVLECIRKVLVDK